MEDDQTFSWLDTVDNSYPRRSLIISWKFIIKLLKHLNSDANFFLKRGVRLFYFYMCDRHCVCESRSQSPEKLSMINIKSKTNRWSSKEQPLVISEVIPKERAGICKGDWAGVSCTQVEFWHNFCKFLSGVGGRRFGELEDMERLGYLVEEVASNKVNFVHCRTFGALVV